MCRNRNKGRHNPMQVHLFPAFLPHCAELPLAGAYWRWSFGSVGISSQYSWLSSVPPRIGPNSERKSAQKRHKTPANRAGKCSQVAHSLEDEPQSEHPPGGALLLLFAFRQLRPHFQFMRLPVGRSGYLTCGTGLRSGCAGSLRI